MGQGIRFTTDFKREAVRLASTSGRPRAEIAEDLGVELSSLTRWVGQYRGDETPPEIEDDQRAELKRLRKENVVLRQERDILKIGEPRRAIGPRDNGERRRRGILQDHQVRVDHAITL